MIIYTKDAHKIKAQAIAILQQVEDMERAERFRDIIQENINTGRDNTNLSHEMRDHFQNIIDTNTAEILRGLDAFTGIKRQLEESEREIID